MTRSTHRFGPRRCLLPLHLAILVAGAGAGRPASGADRPAAPEPAAARVEARPAKGDATAQPSGAEASTAADISDALDAGVIAFVQEHSPELDAKAAHLGYRKKRSMAWYDRQIDRIREERDELVEARMKSLLREQPGRRETATDGGR